MDLDTAQLRATHAIIMERLLAHTPQERQDLMHAIKYNRIFCTECGYGGEEHPNCDCQCLNDE